MHCNRLCATCGLAGPRAVPQEQNLQLCVCVGGGFEVTSADCVKINVLTYRIWLRVITPIGTKVGEERVNTSVLKMEETYPTETFVQHTRLMTSHNRRQYLSFTFIYYNLIIHRLLIDGLTKSPINDVKGSWNRLDNMEAKPRDARQFDYLQVFLLHHVISRLALNPTCPQSKRLLTGRKAEGECGSRDMATAVRYWGAFRNVAPCLCASSCRRFERW